MSARLEAWGVVGLPEVVPGDNSATSSLTRVARHQMVRLLIAMSWS